MNIDRLSTDLVNMVFPPMVDICQPMVGPRAVPANAIAAPLRATFGP